MTTTALIIYIICSLAFSAFFSGMEIAFVSSSKLRFEMDRSQSGFNTRLAATFYEHPNNFISTLLVGNNIALVVYGILIAQLLDTTVMAPLGITDEWLTLLIETVISTIIVLFTGEFLPKLLFKLNPNKTLIFFAPIAYLFYILLYPIAKFTSGLSKLILRAFGLKVSNTDTETAFTKVDLDYLIQSTIDHSDNEEDINDEVKIFQNALDFSNCKVRDCIVPRTEIVAVDINESLNDLKQLFIESGCSKIIVYEEDIDNIVGFIHSSEMFRLKGNDSWKEHIREVPIVPESRKSRWPSSWMNSEAPAASAHSRTSWRKSSEISRMNTTSNSTQPRNCPAANTSCRHDWKWRKPTSCSTSSCPRAMTTSPWADSSCISCSDSRSSTRSSPSTTSNSRLSRTPTPKLSSFACEFWKIEPPHA